MRRLLVTLTVIGCGALAAMPATANDYLVGGLEVTPPVRRFRAAPQPRVVAMPVIANPCPQCPQPAPCSSCPPAAQAAPVTTFSAGAHTHLQAAPVRVAPVTTFSAGAFVPAGQQPFVTAFSPGQPLAAPVQAVTVRRPVVAAQPVTAFSPFGPAATPVPRGMRVFVARPVAVRHGSAVFGQPAPAAPVTYGYAPGYSVSPY